MNTISLHSWWSQRAPREQTILKLATSLVGFALLWWVALAPGLRTLRTFEATRQAQATQLQAMQQMQAQAKVLQEQPRIAQAQALQALQTSVQQAFGTKADITSSAANATVTLRGVSAESLAQWLASARKQARSAPTQARLTRAGATWSGTLTLALPPT
jgi:general secretion pathway protein M